MAITKKDVEYVAKLARLSLTEEEKERFTVQLGHILDYMETLQKIDTRGVEPTSHPFSTKTVWREDAVRPLFESDPILENAPNKEESFFKVKKVIE